MLHLGLLYLCSLVVLVVYSILYGVTSKEARWLGALTSVAVVILGNAFSVDYRLFVLCICFFDILVFCCTDWNLGLCSFRFELLKSRTLALFVAGASRVFLMCFGVHYWFVFIFVLL